MSEPRLNREQTRVICGWQWLDGRECLEWLARWSDDPEFDVAYDKEGGLEVHSDWRGYLTIRPGFRREDTDLEHQGGWRMSANGKRRRLRGIKYRQPPQPPLETRASGWEDDPHGDLCLETDPAWVKCPACRQWRLLDPTSLSPSFSPK